MNNIAVKNKPSLGEYREVLISPEENERRIQQIKDILVLIGIEHMKSKDK